MAIEALRIDPSTLETIETFQVPPTELRFRRRFVPRPRRFVSPPTYLKHRIHSVTEGTLVLVNENFDPLTEQRVEASRNIVGNVLTVTFTVSDLPTGQLRASKRQSVAQEGLTRVQAELPGISDFDVLQLIKEFWLSIAPAARQPTPKFQKAIDIYQAAEDAITVINGLTGAPLKAYDPVTGPAWPA